MYAIRSYYELVDVLAEQHGRRRRDVAGAIGGRRHHRFAEGSKDLVCDPVGGHPHCDGVEAGPGEDVLAQSRQPEK